MKIEKVAIENLIPYARNSRTHSDEQVAQIAASIKEFGFNNPVLIDESGSIIAGHGRILAARKLGLNEAPCIRLSHLSETQRRAYVIADNKLALNAGWDIDMLKIELSELDLDGFDLTLTGFGEDELLDFEESEQNSQLDDEKYTIKTDVFTYEPSEEKPDINDIFSTEKTLKLIDAINKSNAPESIKSFLTIAAYRHTVFDFQKIADFYAHQTQEIQNLMEQSALIIIDYEDAISGGFVMLTKELQTLSDENND
ncbi:ParB/Sulfiredoxin [uncultured Caudovirales phage]|uniref:ParB/Sulfiredoxin n=1 Tax=uncultured Caudovirales phage TaxID=2100421 RepID=A0A6J5PI82_9CAUD|nr:ParB/Sulfiredoxin [uncultured Caudovirales phage]